MDALLVLASALSCLFDTNLVEKKNQKRSLAGTSHL
nr:MAG TPA: hypothetical protein [Caudoviricetes sp.]